ncbi:DUF4138 domain-containing protein [Chryseobacterium sp. A301]
MKTLFTLSCTRVPFSKASQSLGDQMPRVLQKPACCFFMSSRNREVAKRILLVSSLLLCTLAKSQSTEKEKSLSSLPVLKMKPGVNVHIVSPEPIEFVDLSTSYLLGDLPTENLARIKVLEDSLAVLEKQSRGESGLSSNLSSFSFAERSPYTYQELDLGIVTIVAKSFMAQYRAVYGSQGSHEIQSSIYIYPQHMQPLEFSRNSLSPRELLNFCEKILSRKELRPLARKKGFGLTLNLNGLYVVGDYVFLDVLIENKTNLKFQMESILFSVEDKKIYKATNHQSIALSPVYSHHSQKEFRSTYRNVFVFEKFSFPNSKTLRVRLVEEELSGRSLTLEIPYSALLKADTL